MKSWDLSTIFEHLHSSVANELTAAREALHHPGTKGDASEKIWRNLLSTYLPKRYYVTNAHVVDSGGNFSEQIDIVIIDRQYSPFIFEFGGYPIVPAECVYAIFEAKQTVNASIINYAHKKISSVRKPIRTSLPISSAQGTLAAKNPLHILGGLLCLESDWNPAMGSAFISSISNISPIERLDIGCVAAHGIYSRQESGEYEPVYSSKPATAFLFELIARLQELATVPMIDIRAYARFL